MLAKEKSRGRACCAVWQPPSSGAPAVLVVHAFTSPSSPDVPFTSRSTPLLDAEQPCPLRVHRSSRGRVEGLLLLRWRRWCASSPTKRRRGEERGPRRHGPLLRRRVAVLPRRRWRVERRLRGRRATSTVASRSRRAVPSRRGRTVTSRRGRAKATRRTRRATVPARRR
jgi:hypothetical protein